MPVRIGGCIPVFSGIVLGEMDRRENANSWTRLRSINTRRMLTGPFRWGNCIPFPRGGGACVLPRHQTTTNHGLMPWSLICGDVQRGMSSVHTSY
jgi:hypothetical protein